MLRIAICGIDGSGKSTLVAKLIKQLSLDNLPVDYAQVTFPAKEICTVAKFDCYESTQEIVKRTGMAFDFVRYYLTVDTFDGVLLCDRYDVDYEVLNKVYELSEDICSSLHSIYRIAPPIDLYIYLKICPSEAALRLERRGDRAKDESDSILQKMSFAFDENFIQRPNAFMIDAMLSQDEIANIAKLKIYGLWEKKLDR